ncbi:GAF domain-containing sensor histidine kinase [Paenibacillus pabuli]|uniref:GAF domain-containing sensor histidine kinase n=1 Tax=Paenibacillus pabuli TaxID=1472 RepID=UPI00324259EB
MSQDSGMQELYTLKTIAETLNTSNDLSPMLDTVVGKLLELTGLTAGWVFLIRESGEYSCISDYNLPPALVHQDKEPMRCGTCWCVNRFRDGKLNNAVNIINCKRLEDATEHQWGDTQGITHHATVPLRSGDKMMGLLNVAAPGKEHFSDGELALLQAVAYQIGSAMERMRLYRAEQRRADQYARLGEFSRSLGLELNECSNADDMARTVVKLLEQHYEWPFVALLVQKNGIFTVQAAHASDSEELQTFNEIPAETDRWLRRVIQSHRAGILSAEEIVELSQVCGTMPRDSIRSPGLAAAIPLSPPGETAVLIAQLDSESDSLQADREVVDALAEHITASWESLRLVDKRRELTRLEERNRLARDLHDSVNQILFSLSLTAKGAESMLSGTADLHPAAEAMRDIRSLSQEALKEMRALIMQLRPAGLESGLLSALQEYGSSQGLQVVVNRTGMRSLPRSIEEGLWRIGQEALNNVRKHADVTAADITLQLRQTEAVFIVKDRGKGGAKRKQPLPARSLGLSIMRERAQSLGGKLELISSSRKGTSVTVVIPLPSEQG